MTRAPASRPHDGADDGQCELDAVAEALIGCAEGSFAAFAMRLRFAALTRRPYDPIRSTVRLSRRVVLVWCVAKHHTLNCHIGVIAI